MSTTRNQWKKILGLAIAMCTVIACVGCGVQQGKQTDDARQTADGAALYTGETINKEAVKRQLEVMVKRAKKWRSSKDVSEEDVTRYAVTDLNQNGKLEIMVYKYWDQNDDCVFLGGYEVNASEDGLEAIEVAQEGKNFTEDIAEVMDTAYYDAKSGQYHYVFHSELPEDALGVKESDYRRIIALTLKKNKITSDTIGYRTDGDELIRNIQGNKTEIDESEYSKEKLGDTVYADCAKLTVQISPFSFDHLLDDMTEKQMLHALEKSYREFYMGYPLEQQKIMVAGHKIRIPQYTTMRDTQKQERVNRMILEVVERSLNGAYEMQDKKFRLDYAGITIKYAGRDRVSLLLEALGYYEGAAHSREYYDTITIDLEKEKILSSQDILPKEYWEDVETDILNGICDDILRGKEYREYREEMESLLSDSVDWQDVKFYQTRDDIGVVVPTDVGIEPHAIYEVTANRYWSMGLDEEVDYPNVNWEAYQYKLLAGEYKRLQEYIPVLMGKKEITWTEISGEDNEEIPPKRKLSLSSYLSEYFDDNMQLLTCIALCDLTQDGKQELILHFASGGGLYLILHQEGSTFYGTGFSARCFQGLQENGVYGVHGGISYSAFCQLHFEGEDFVEEVIAKREDSRYYIHDKKVDEDAYTAWADAARSKDVRWYRPEMLPNQPR